MSYNTINGIDLKSLDINSVLELILNDSSSNYDTKTIFDLLVHFNNNKTLFPSVDTQKWLLLENGISIKKQVVDIIKTYLLVLAKLDDKNQKILIADNLFKYVVQNKWFLDVSSDFSSVIKNKLEEFEKDNLTPIQLMIFNPHEYHKSLFG